MINLRLRLRFANCHFFINLDCFFLFLLKISGLSPRAADSSGRSPLVDTGKANGGFVSVQYAGTPSASEPDGGYTGPGLAQRLPK